MKKKLQILLLLMLCVNFSNAQYVVWGKQMGPDYRGIEPRAIATDTAGNIIYVGNDRIAMANIDVFVRKTNAQGQLLWEFRNNGCNSTMDLTGVTTDLNGNIYVLGLVYCSDMILQNFHLVDSTSNYIKNFVLKLDMNGHLIYVKDVADDVTAIKADVFGNCYVTGSAGTQKLDVNGNLKWINSTCAGIALDVSITGNVFVTDGNSTWRINSFSGNINWQNATVGGSGIACNDLLNRVYVVNSGLVKIQFLGKRAQITHYTTIGGTKVACDLIGNVYVSGLGSISKKSIWNGKITSLSTPSGIDFAVNYKGQVCVLGAFNNMQQQISYCNFTTTLVDPGSYCLYNCPEDGYLLRVSFDQPPLTTIYNYSSICVNQVNPVSHCSDQQFNAGNSFRIELSDANGSFVHPALTGVEPGIYIPAGLPSGTNYRFRVRSTSPAITGIPSAPFSITSSPGTITISPVGLANLCDSNYVHLRATDSTGNAIVCNWFVSELWKNHWVNQYTGTDFIATTEGNYYAAYSSCFDVSNSIDLMYDCRTAGITTGSEIQLSAFPNPSKENFNLLIKNVNSQGWISIYNVAGELVEKISCSIDEQLTVGTDWPNGVYLCKAAFPQGVKNLKLIKIK